MELAAQLKRGISRQFSTGSLSLNRKFSFNRQNSLDPRRNNMRFSFGRQSSLDPITRSLDQDELSVPENLDSTMQLLFMACRGDVRGVQDLLDDGIDVNSIDLDGRTALHIAACEGHVEVAKLLLTRRANIDARDRWGSTAAADAKHYGNMEVYSILKARGAKTPKTSKTPMAVANPIEVPEYELNPLELQVRKSDGITKGAYQVAKWNGTKVAVKILDKDSCSNPESINAFKHELMLLEKVRHPNDVIREGLQNAFKHELMLLEKVRHPNVVQFVGAVTQNMPMMIVSEYHSKGDLGSYIHKKGRLSPSKALRFALDIARGMNCLHEFKPDPIIHCDIRPKNLLLDAGGQIKVAGFGLIRLSKISHDKAKLLQPEVQIDLSNLYLAPEVYKDEIFDRSVDVYSFGLILYEMLEGVQPLHPKTPADAAKSLCLEGIRPVLKTKSKNAPSDLKDLIEECWDPNPVIRPTFLEIITRLDRIVLTGSKNGWWKKLPWI